MSIQEDKRKVVGEIVDAIAEVNRDTAIDILTDMCESFGFVMLYEHTKDLDHIRAAATSLVSMSARMEK